MFGNQIAKYVTQGSCRANVSTWSPLQVGTSPLQERKWLEIQVRGTTALAIAYANKNSDGTFTTPTVSGHHTIIIPANSIKVIPVGDAVTVYGRAVNKVASNAGGCKVVVAEFA